MEAIYTSLDDLLGYFYVCQTDYTDGDFWKMLTNVLKIPQENVIGSLYVSEEFILKVFKFLITLPYKKSSRKILKILTSYLDPSSLFFRKIIQQLVPCLQSEIPCLSTLNVCLATYNSIFEQQRPANENLDSHIYLYGSQTGIIIKQLIKWPFEKGGTLTFWYNMNEKTKQCKIFQFLTQQKIGFEIIMKNKKIYIQKQQQQKKFRLIKNTSSYLCDALFNKNVKLCVQFQIRKKFFQPYLSINLTMNNFVLNGVQIDSFSTNANLFQMKLFKGFIGKFYATLIMNQKLSAQVDQINNQKGFIYDSDIRNFCYLFQNSNDKVILLLSAIRAKTFFQQSQHQQKSLSQHQDQFQDQLSQKIHLPTKQIKTQLYNCIGSYTAYIPNSKACCYYNISINKQMNNYGGFQSLIPFVKLLQICCCSDQMYNIALNQFLQLIKLVFQNKSDSIQKACQIQFFKLLSSFFNKTKMQGFSYQTITKLKQIYISLNTRMLRQKYIQQVVWGINFTIYLNQQNFNNYIKFIKTFYNQDIQSSLHIFDIYKIIHYIVGHLDYKDCCFQHVGYKLANQKINTNNNSNNNRNNNSNNNSNNNNNNNSNNGNTLTHNLSSNNNHKYIAITNYPKILQSILQIIQNIILIKRMQPDINLMLKKIIQSFSLTISPCFIQALLLFLQNIFKKDEIIQKQFIHFIFKQNYQARLNLYKCLSGCNSQKTKAKIIQFILHILENSFFDDLKNQREMLTLCARYPTTNYLRTSSIKSKSNQNRDSIDYSEDKLSLNSATMYKLIIINPIQQKNQILIDNFNIIQVIFDWAFSENIFKLIEEDHQNPGLLILMELYKGSTYKIRLQITQMIRQKMKLVRFSPELMAWAIQCSLIAQYDLSQSTTQTTQISQTKQNLIQLISNYTFSDIQQQQQNNQLSIIKLVFSSVKCKYADDITKIVGNKLFFIICDKKMQTFVQQLKIHDHNDLMDYDKLCMKIVSNVFTFMSQYYIIKGDGDQIQFDQDMAQIVQSQNNIVLQIMQRILQIFVLLANINDRKIIQQANAQRNHLVITMLFPQKQKDKQKQKINIMYQILGALQNIFDLFEDMDIEPKKKCILLIKKYIIFLIQLTENSGSAKLQQIQQDLKNIFLINIGFIQQKYHQYFYYPFQRHKNIDFQLQNKIRRSIDEIKRTLFNIFLDFIQLIQYIDEKGDLQHKSFYQLMKPKRKHVHKYSLKHIYPDFLKKSDEKIKEFLCLKRQALRKDAQQKLQSYMVLKKVSQYCSTIQKNVAKKLFIFVQTERKQTDMKQKKSVNFYKITQSQKCRNFCECQELLVQFRIKMSEEQRNYINKQKQLKIIQHRKLILIQKKLWNANRTFEGFWANKDFYLFSQNQAMQVDNTLHKFYTRVRSSRQSKYFLMPFIKIEAISAKNNQMIQQHFYSNESFMQGATYQKNIAKKSTSDKVINGLQFIKRKVYSKLLKTIAVKQQQKIMQSHQAKAFVIQNVLWIKPMKVYLGNLKIQSGKLSYCHKSGKNFQHISLFKNILRQSQNLIKQWNISDIQGMIQKRFLLKPNSVQLYLKNRKSIFLCFYSNSTQQYYQIITKLNQIINSSLNQFLFFAHFNSIKQFQNTQITQKWLNYQISNLQYLMYLNIASGRTNCDLNQYPIMPWIFSQYVSTKFKKNQQKIRDFNKNTAQLGKQQRIKKFQQLYQNLSINHTQQFPIPHYFGFHYSNLGIILQYLIRVNPYSLGAKQLQGGNFDIPDRLFNSIPESYRHTTTEMSDLRQLIPQFFYFPQFLINYQQFQFGKLQGQKKIVNHVQLPDGCMNAYDFIQHHRQGLQSKQVSINLHKWIDLIFGYKNSGKQAQKNMNTYHYLTNQINCNRIDSVQDIQQRQALQSQMAYYGKTPSQLFTRPHPQRQPKNKINFDLWQKTVLNIQDHFSKLSQPTTQRFLQQILHFSYCQKTKSYMLITKIGKGLIFLLQKKQIIKIKQFNFQYQRLQDINIIDKTTNLSTSINKYKNKLAIQNIQCCNIVIGGLWNGKLLLLNTINQQYQIYIKHTQIITALKYSPIYKLLFSGTINGQLCKWQYKQKKLQYIQKINCLSRINTIKIYQDLKIIQTCTQLGCLYINNIQNLNIIRILKLPYPILQFSILKYPFYNIFIVCQGGHQYCYSINGTKLQQCQLEIVVQNDNDIDRFQCDCHCEEVLVRIENQLVFLKMPELEIQRKVQVGIINNIMSQNQNNFGNEKWKNDGNESQVIKNRGQFIFLSHYMQIIAINQKQMIAWRRPTQEFVQMSDN